jgi:hypothetical protein
MSPPNLSHEDKLMLRHYNSGQWTYSRFDAPCVIETFISPWNVLSILGRTRLVEALLPNRGFSTEGALLLTKMGHL